MLTPCVLSSRGRVLLVVATTVLATFVAAWCRAADRPNIVYIQADMAETKNVAAEHPDVVRQLRELLERYRTAGGSRE